MTKQVALFVVAALVTTPAISADWVERFWEHNQSRNGNWHEHSHNYLSPVPVYAPQQPSLTLAEPEPLPTEEGSADPLSPEDFASADFEQCGIEQHGLNAKDDRQYFEAELWFTSADLDLLNCIKRQHEAAGLPLDKESLVETANSMGLRPSNAYATAE